MECECGYSFIRAAIDADKPYESYAVIDDETYKEFLTAELAAAHSRRLEDIATASQYVGTMAICPACRTVTINWPGGHVPESHYRPIDS